MGFVWIGEKLFSFGATDYHLPEWVSYVVLAVMVIAIGSLVGLMFWNSRASAIIDLVFMTVNLFFLFFSIDEVKFVNPSAMQQQSPDAFREQYALGVWVWGAIVFALASLSITANIHKFFTNGKYESLYIDRHGRIGSETKGLDETQKTWIAFLAILAVSVGVVALGLYVNMWWLQGYSIALVAVSVIQVIVNFKFHDFFDD